MLLLPEIIFGLLLCTILIGAAEEAETDNIGEGNVMSYLTIPIPVEFDPSQNSSLCKTGPQFLIEMVSASRHGYIYCNQEPDAPIGVAIINNFKSNDLFYSVQVINSTCAPKKTDCFNKPTDPQNEDFSHYIYITNENDPDVADQFRGTYLSPAKGVTVLQCYSVIAVDRPTQTVSSNYLEFCVTVQAYISPDAYCNPIY